MWGVPVIRFIILLYCGHRIEPMEWNTQRLCNYVRNISKTTEGACFSLPSQWFSECRLTSGILALLDSCPPNKHVISTRQVVVLQIVPFILALYLLTGCMNDKWNKYVSILTRLSGVIALFDYKTIQTLFTFLPVFKWCWYEIIETTCKSWRWMVG